MRIKLLVFLLSTIVITAIFYLGGYGFNERGGLAVGYFTLEVLAATISLHVDWEVDDD